MIVPAPTPSTEPYWHAAAEGRFLLRRCAECEVWHPPWVEQCCATVALAWQEASGRGWLVSFTIVRRALHEGFADGVPYTITLTRTVEGPQLVTSLPGDGHAMHIGTPMRVGFRRLDAVMALPVFEPSPAGAPGDLTDA